MKNWQAFSFRVDSPQFVIAHAKLQRSKGKKPSVCYAGIRNPRLAFQTAKLVLSTEAERERTVAEEVRVNADALDKHWRDDLRPKELPSASFTVTHTSDRVRVHGLFELFINHVTSFHGKGFKAVLKHGGSTQETGDVHLGVDSPAFDLALSDGETILARHVQKLQYAMEKQDELERRLHRPRKFSRK